MNDMIIFSRLSRTVAELTQCAEADAENFLRELFQLAYEQLESDGRVTVPGLGTFVVTEETVAFAPDAELAETINAPFGAFEAVELPEDEPEEVAEKPVAAPAEPASEEVAEPLPELLPEPAPAPAPEPQEEPEPVEEPKEEPEDVPQEDDPADEPVEESDPDRRRSRAWIMWVAACVGCFALGWYAGRYHAPDALAEPDVKPAEEMIADASADSVAADSAAVTAAARPAAPVTVTDTITSRRFLTTMARAHYGCMEYWVYIYEANADRLGHPDRLSAGTVVVIPPADSLGLRTDDEARLAEAGRKALEIYARFN